MLPSSSLKTYYITHKPFRRPRRWKDPRRLHLEGCEWLARAGDAQPLGEFWDYESALTKANALYRNIATCSGCAGRA